MGPGVQSTRLSPGTTLDVSIPLVPFPDSKRVSMKNFCDVVSSRLRSFVLLASSRTSPAVLRAARVLLPRFLGPFLSSRPSPRLSTAHSSIPRVSNTPCSRIHDVPCVQVAHLVRWARPRRPGAAPGAWPSVEAVGTPPVRIRRARTPVRSARQATCTSNGGGDGTPSPHVQAGWWRTWRASTGEGAPCADEERRDGKGRVGFGVSHGKRM
eukprot:scaffold1328_cov375-Pavlova_lutheri.AAC.17